LLLLLSLGCYPASKFFSGSLHWWDSTIRLEKVGKCNLADGERQCSFLCSYKDNICAFDVYMAD
jgi:hypothetical protein